MTITLKANPDGVTGAIQVNGNDAVVIGSQGITQGAPLSFRNKIINGKMDIAQRGTSFISGVNVYTADRWLVDYVADGGATTSRSSDVPSSNEFQNSLRITQNAADTSIAAAQYARFEQRIEGFNARDLVGCTFTISFWVRSSKTGIHCVSLRNIVVGNSGDRSYIAEYTINSANTWEFKTITVSGGLITDGANWNWTNGIGLSIGFTIACGSTFQTTAGAWQTGNFVATANQVNCLDTVGNIFAITGVQLEAGSIATPFEHRPYGTELALCQRYFQSFFRPVLRGSGTASALNRIAMTLPVRMRVAPTASSLGTHYWFDGVGTGTFTSIDGAFSDIDSVEFDVTPATGAPIAGRATGTYKDPANTGVLNLTAEL